MVRNPSYEVVVIGGGPAGKTTALYTTRLGHRTALFDAAGGRHTAVEHVHNVLGVSEETSGRQLSEIATDQLVEYGADYYDDAVESAVPVDDGDRGDAEDGRGAPRFHLTAEHATVVADCVVLATGFTDRPPRVQGLRRFTGRGLHYCLHCDAYTLGDGQTFVLGHDDHAARVAMILLNFTADVDLLLHGEEPTWDSETSEQVAGHPVNVVEREVTRALPQDEDDPNSWLGGLEFADGTTREYAGGFAMYGSDYDTHLAEELGCELGDDGAVVVDEDRRTSVEGVYAVGDLTHGQNQTLIAMGDGAYAGVALHKELRTYPVSAANLDEDGVESSEVPAVDPALRARMRWLRERGTDAGMTPDD